MSGLIVDRAVRDADSVARAAAQTIFDRPLVIEAGAGTGKTQTLVGRIVAWAIGPGWERAQARLAERAGGADVSPDRVAARVLSGVVAITFTEAAAAEMATRLAAVLGAIERGEQPVGLLDAVLAGAGEDLCIRARALLAALDHAVIRTIHAYCRRLLSRYPLEAGVHPNLRVDADATLQNEIVRTVVEHALRRGYTEPNDALLLELAEWRIGPVQIEEALNALVAQGIPADALGDDPFDAQRIAAAVAELDRCLADFRAAMDHLLAAFTPTSTPGKVNAAFTATLNFRADSPMSTKADLDRCSIWLRATWPKALLTRLRSWERADFGHKEREVFDDRASTIADAAAHLRPLLTHWQQLDIAQLDLSRRALQPLLAAVYQRLRTAGIATYAALLHDVHRLLDRHPDTAAAIRGEIDQLLVDEFQDTDVVQCAIIRTLALCGDPARRPALFLVGDPKQSIYGWRSADLRAYDEFVDEVVASGGVRHALTVNYRSLPLILTEVGRVIAPTMQRTAGLQPAFQPLIPSAARVAADTARTQPAVEYWVSTPWSETAGRLLWTAKAADVVQLEARTLADDIRRLHDTDGVPWSDIAVLFRSSGDLDGYLGALRDAEIPYLVEGDRQFYERREVIDCFALLRVILAPRDQLALLTLIRSAMVGVPDAALLPLWSRGLPDAVARLIDSSSDPLDALSELIAAAATDLPPDIPGLDRVRGWDENLRYAVRAIAALRASFATEPVDTFVERLRTTMLPEATEASRRLGAYRLANLQRFFRLLLAALEAGETDPQQLLRRIRVAIAQRIDAEEERPGDSADDAVRVLTIHRAKGLDFEHVYVMQLHKEPGTTWTTPVDVSIQNGHAEYRLFGGRTLGFAAVEARRAAVAAAEQVRTLYVAMTRAKSRLVLCGKWPADPRPVQSEGARSQVRLLFSRSPVPPALEGLLGDARAAGRPYVDIDGVRWMFAGLQASRDQHAGHAPPWSVDAKALRVSAQRLDQLAAQAAAHGTRPFVTAVSTATMDLFAEEGRESPTMRGAAYDRNVARAAGIAVHAVLEIWEPPVDPCAILHRQIARWQTLLHPYVSGAALHRALNVAAASLTAFANNDCGRRFFAIAPTVLARELPVIIPPDGAGSGPTGCYTGAIDLLYRDPDTTRIVVADYKTDQVHGDDEIAKHVDEYRVQGAHYVRAIQEALHLPTPPRFELWFIVAGRIEVVTEVQ